MKVKIPAGVDNGSHLRLQGEGDAGYKGGAQGDLYLVLHVPNHDIFIRDGYDIFLQLPISISQAALGDKIQVPSLEGNIKLTIPEGTQTNTVFRLSGKGIPYLQGRGRGDQHVQVVVATPRNLSKRQRDLFTELASENGQDVNQPKKGFFEKFVKGVKDSL